jgi:hypothetical protein
MIRIDPATARPYAYPFGFFVLRQIFVVLIRAGVLVCPEGGLIFSARLWGRADGMIRFGPRLSERRLAAAWEAMKEPI